MCGIAGIVSIEGKPVANLQRKLDVMDKILAHRGPDGHGSWVEADNSVGLAHRRLSIVDLTPSGAQPMIGEDGNVIVYNGEVYNAPDLMNSLSHGWRFRGHSDTEAVMAAYQKYGTDVLEHLHGMFGFAVWDSKNKRLFCARDRFGIKPFYYTVVDGCFVFASEAKALLPFLPDIKTDANALAEYLVFQYNIGEDTLFEGIKQLLPGHCILVENGTVKVERYWDVRFEVDWDHSESYFLNRLPILMDNSVNMHLRSDVEVGAYLSGGIDSSLVSALSAERGVKKAFHGRFTDHQGYDESHYAHMVAKQSGLDLHVLDITAQDFMDNIQKVIYHLDFPVAGPGAFPQYMVSKLAAEHVKVIVGGQGGDEIFGGYARYLVAYMEQCLRAAIDDTYQNGNFVVTLESIIPNLPLLQEYKPMIRSFWKDGIFNDLDARYFRLIDRSSDMHDEVDWNLLNKEKVFEDFRAIFNRDNVGKEAYFDQMTHFDFKCLLPALLHVEDRVSMAHGLESRVPILNHHLVEFVATAPADVKFKGGQQKRMLKKAYSKMLPDKLLHRRDKMGFPVPLREWFDGPLSNMLKDVFNSSNAQNRAFMNSDKVLEGVQTESRFSRKTWGLLSLELWHQQFHDKTHKWRGLIHAQ